MNRPPSILDGLAASGRRPGGALPRIAVVLPPREGFGPHSAGAIGLLQARLLGGGAERHFDVAIWGAPQKDAVFGLPFRAVAPRGWLGSAALRHARGLAAAFRADPPALIEVHNRPDIAGFLAARLPASRVLLFLHNDPRGMRGADTPGRRQALARRLAGIVCVSRFLRDLWMEGAASPMPEPAILPNCLDLATLPPPVPVGARDRLLLFAGRMVADKGADTFVAACALALPRLPGWRAALIGADRFRPDSPETPFTARLRPMAAAAGVTLAGFHDHAAVMAAFGRAGIAILPSRWQEPFGLTALEAMASGCALVTSDRGGLAELCADVAAFADPEDPAAVAEAILAFAGDAAARQRAADLGRTRAEAYDVAAARALLDRIRMDVLHS